LSLSSDVGATMAGEKKEITFRIPPFRPTKDQLQKQETTSIYETDKE